jgi:hypothetical protein
MHDHVTLLDLVTSVLQREGHSISLSFSNLTLYLFSPTAPTTTPHIREHTRRLCPFEFATNSIKEPETLTAVARLLGRLGRGIVAVGLLLFGRLIVSVECE